MKRKIESLPYVDGAPGEFQNRIEWIRDGEPLNGASTRFGHEGPLNRAGTQIQQNVEFVHSELSAVSLETDTLVVEVNQIKETLEIVGDLDAITQVYKNKDDIVVLQNDVLEQEGRLNRVNLTVDGVVQDIGPYDASADSKYRTIRGNIVFLKNEMGAYPGQDKNGDLVDGAPGSGMKYRIISNSDAISKTTARVKVLEDSFVDSDVGQLSGRIDVIRAEIGPESQATADSIYTRLDTDNTRLGELKTGQTILNDAVDISNPKSISVRMVEVEERSLHTDAIVSAAGTGLVDRVGVIEAELGDSTSADSIVGRLDSVQTSQEEILEVVGADASSGMRGQIAWINQKVGIVGPGETPTADSVEGRLTVVQATQTEQSITLQDIQVDNLAIKGDVSTLNKTVYGDPAATEQFDIDGLKSTVRKIDGAYVSDVDTLDSYVRTKGQWVKKCMAIGRFEGSAITAPLDQGTFDYSFGPGLTASDFNHRIRVINDEIIIDEEAVYRLSATVGISTATADKFYGLAISVNDVEIGDYSWGVRTISGKQVLKSEWTGRIDAAARVKLTIKAMDASAQVSTVIDDIYIDVCPAR